jgi:hypothetical protein
VLRGFFDELRWRRVLATLSPERIVLTVDGEVALSQDLPPHYTTDWLEAPRLALGSEVVGGRQWRGRLRTATVTTGQQTFDYLHSDRLHTPSAAFYIPERLHDLRRLVRDEPLEMLLHFFSFIPFGYLLGLLRPGKASLRTNVVYGTGLALGILLTKVFFANRHPCLIDVPLQGLGTWLGAWLALTRTAAPRKSGT